MSEGEQRHETLGDDVIPYHYKLRFDTDFKTFRFKGDEEIFAVSKAGVTVIRLNSKELEIGRVEIENLGKVQTATVEEDRKREMLKLVLKNPVSGICKIRISFVGINNDKMYGFYRSSYKRGSRLAYMLTSQFESTDARSAFPCFDEPAMKATFSVTIVSDRGYEAISNMPIEKERVAGSRREVLFHTTPKMSTYLLYLGVGKFEYAEGVYSGVRYRVVTVPGKKDQAKLALGYARNFVSFYEKYFGIRYMLPKLDIIAIPDFAAGAMENWGAITFRETAILGDEESAVSTKQYIAVVVAHELAHQWFGDLVTMRWWDDLWLNESFATYMSYKAADNVYPEWKLGVQYLKDTVSLALTADEFAATHPISVHVKSPAEIEEIFDRISYEKGGSVLMMLEDFVGKETFRQGLNLYLNKHLYGNAENRDLWDAVGEEARREGKNVDVKRVAEAWIERPGYPEIMVSDEGSTFLLKQKRCFLVEGTSKSAEQPMPIPLRYLYSNGKSGFLLFEDAESAIPKDDASWIKLNYGQKGLYRATYSGTLLDRIGGAIKSGKLDGADSWGVENDLFDIVRKGGADMSTYLDFIRNYCLYCAYPANVDISSHLTWMYKMLYGSRESEDVKEVIAVLGAVWLGRLGWKKRAKDSNTDIIMRSAAIGMLGLIEDKKVVDKAISLFNGRRPIDPDMRGAIYGINSWTGDRKVFDRVERMYKAEDVADEKRRLLFSIGDFKQKELAEKALEFSSSVDVRLQDSVFIPMTVASNPATNDVYWSWAKRNWKALMKRYKGVPRMLLRLVEATGSFSSPALTGEVLKFFSRKGNTADDIKRGIEQTEEKLKANSRFISRNRKAAQ